MPTGPGGLVRPDPHRGRAGNREQPGSGGSTVARPKLKGIDGRAHKGWSLRLNLTQHGEPYQGRTPGGSTDRRTLRDSAGGGAWPFLVGGAIRLVNSDNERDPGPRLGGVGGTLNGVFTQLLFARRGDGLRPGNREVGGGAGRQQVRDALQTSWAARALHWRGPSGLVPFRGSPAERRGGSPGPAVTGIGRRMAAVNEESLVGAGRQPAPDASPPFVHTARRSYRSDGPARAADGRPRLRVRASGSGPNHAV